MDRAWITPDDPPGNPVSYRVFLPPGLLYRRAFIGAMLLLADSQNWEQIGGESPGTVADAFANCHDLTDPLRLSMEIGAIMNFAGAAPPSLWLACDGAEYDQADYPALYAVIGSAFGSSGAGVFNVPDLRGRAPVGAGSGPGLTARNLASVGGVESVVLDVTEIPAHDHTVDGHDHSIHAHGIPIPVQSGLGAIVETDSIFGGNTGSASPDTDNTGGDAAHENMPPFIAINFIIFAGL